MRDKELVLEILRQIEEAASCSGRGPLNHLTQQNLDDLWASNFS